MRVLIIGCVALALGMPALAQDGSEAGAGRTADGAQKFMSDFYAQGGLKAMTYKIVQNGAYGPWPTGEQIQTDASGKWNSAYLYGGVAKWTPLDRCRTQVELDNARSSYEQSVQLPAQSVTTEIDWSRVVSVVATQAASALPVPLGDGRYGQVSYFSIGLQARNGSPMLPALLFESKEEADRVTFALDFLRRECVLKSDTGF